ncbi:MAG: LPXTG cell wall anchor domain-containing protein [Desulfovibrionaceae bacterium]|nr:LPXTG cell wall anchor domain-containing protein [Desulfovibrionaceae bacterium]
MISTWLIAALLATLGVLWGLWLTRRKKDD